MKIVDRAAFLAMPSGTVFMKFPSQPKDGRSYDFGYDAVLQIKADTIGNDFVCTDLFPDFEGSEGSDDWAQIMIAAVGGAETPPLDYDNYGRDGLFDADQHFAVWSPEEHRRLIAALQSALDERSTAISLTAPVGARP